MYSQQEAVHAANNLIEFCSGQFCPDCVFNNGHCILGGLGITPKTWNENHELTSLASLMEQQQHIQMSSN